LTCELDGSFVVQVMVAELAVTPVEFTAEMVGATFTVVKVKLPDVWVPPGLLVDTTSKLYWVPGVKPERLTEWAVDAAPVALEP
jgi:hypothetical protein